MREQFPRNSVRSTTLLPSHQSGDIKPTMSKRASKKFFYVLQDRKRLPQRFFAALSGRATAHLG
jgi:hypothetical protein